MIYIFLKSERYKISQNKKLIKKIIFLVIYAVIKILAKNVKDSESRKYQYEKLGAQKKMTIPIILNCFPKIY